MSPVNAFDVLLLALAGLVALPFVVVVGFGLVCCIALVGLLLFAIVREHPVGSLVTAAVVLLIGGVGYAGYKDVTAPTAPPPPALVPDETFIRDLKECDTRCAADRWDGYSTCYSECQKTASSRLRLRGGQ